MKQEKNSRRVHLLRDDVARKIAAGEVIDRPFSVVRELIDNSIDAGSTEISLSLENGGISNIRLVDNGRGMSKEDLKLCFLPHATSKIDNENDIYKTTTMGFRGEALSSIANCSRLDIVSMEPEKRSGNKLVVRDGKLISLEKCQGKQGTIVNAGDLFYNMPARKKFMKRASGETTACKNILIDKALAFPDSSFRFTVDSRLKLFLPPASQAERIASAFKTALSPSLLAEEEAVYDDFSIIVVGGRTEVTRKDRRLIQIFVNNRRIYEYAFIQAVQYAYSEYMPGKDFPVAFVFIRINPELVDFNIHPAKKECRFLNLQEVHHALVAVIRSYLNKFSINIEHPAVYSSPETVQKKLDNFDFSSYGRKKSSSGGNIPAGGSQQQNTLSGNSIGKSYAMGNSGAGYNTDLKDDAHTGDPVPEEVYENLAEYESAPPESVATDSFEADGIKYLGQIFNLFLVAQYKENLFLVDQHAAHEKILYNKIKNESPAIQELMFPLSFEVEDNEKKLLEMNRKALEEYGIYLEKISGNTYEITRMSTIFQPIEADKIIEFLKSGAKENLEKDLISMAACRSAIKDGDTLDPLTAVNLLKETFQLQNARCPHGRPVWYSLSREELCRLMGRK